MKFPAMPFFDGSDPAAMFEFFSSAEGIELLTTFQPYARFQITFPRGQDTLMKRFAWFCEFLTKLQAGASPKGLQARITAFNQIGDLGSICFAKHLVHLHAKITFLDEHATNGREGDTGITIQNMANDFSHTYGILRIAHAFALWLQTRRVNFTLYLREAKKPFEEPVEGPIQ